MMPSATRLVRVPVDEPNPDQLQLLGAVERERTLQERFERFHRENPHVYEQLVLLARRWQRAGNTKGGIGMFFEVLRYRRGLTTAGEEFKLNNNYRSRYSRLIMESEDDLADFFDLRELQTR